MMRFDRYLSGSSEPCFAAFTRGNEMSICNVVGGNY